MTCATSSHVFIYLKKKTLFADKIMLEHFSHVGNLLHLLTHPSIHFIC